MARRCRRWGPWVIHCRHEELQKRLVGDISKKMITERVLNEDSSVDDSGTVNEHGGLEMLWT